MAATATPGRLIFPPRRILRLILPKYNQSCKQRGMTQRGTLLGLGRHATKSVRFWTSRPALQALRAVHVPRCAQDRSYTSAPFRRCPELGTRPAEESASELIATQNESGDFKIDGQTPLIACPGCGALAQTLDPQEAGHYSFKRRGLRCFFDSAEVSSTDGRKIEDGVFQAAMERLGNGLKGSITGPVVSAEVPNSQPSDNASPGAPLCDRCHTLLHHGKGISIVHPSVSSIADTIAESPWKSNHVYHILDAADFPMSLVRGIHHMLDLQPQRSKNRRSKHPGLRFARKAALSYIITRSDLLAPEKAQVDKLMPKLLEILKQAMGSKGEKLRLGNVHCVSAKRGWWTKSIKSDIWERGGAGWMVGKVNVGKSNLFESVFPKGRAEDIAPKMLRSRISLRPGQHQNEHEMLGTTSSDHSHSDSFVEQSSVHESPLIEPPQDFGQDALLPPARMETQYPAMPTVSDLPGTTASPIRIPFGNKRGELVDLPGLKRTDLESLILPGRAAELVMKTRIQPEQLSIKFGQSLLLGGLVRITPKTEGLVVLAYPFVGLKSHVTSASKALEMGMGSRASPFEPLLQAHVSTQLQSAGTFALKTDVTKERAGPLTVKSAVALKPSSLPFQVLSTDILIESIGWVELVAQVRRKPNHRDNSDAMEPDFPEVEVFSPLGQFVASRTSIGAWSLVSRGSLKSRSRPRRSLRK